PVAFSPDQKRIAFMRGSMTRGATDLMVADADGSNVHALAAAPAPDQFQPEGPSWSPDGRTILIAATSSRRGGPAVVYAVDAASGKTQTVGKPWGYDHDVAWLPDGRAFLLTAIDFSGMSTPQIWRVTYPAGERTPVTNDLNGYVGVSVSADGRSLATVQTVTVTSVYVADGADHEPRKISGGPNRAEGTGGVAFMPDGRIVFTSTASGLTQLWISDADGGNARQVTSLPGPALTPRVSADGAWIYFTSYTLEGQCLFRVAPDGSG